MTAKTEIAFPVKGDDGKIFARVFERTLTRLTLHALDHGPDKGVSIGGLASTTGSGGYRLVPVLRRAVRLGLMSVKGDVVRLVTDGGRA